MQLYEYAQEYFSFLDHGEARLKGIKRAIDVALEQQDIANALSLYYQLMRESTRHYDAYQIIVIFPEYLALFEKYPEYHAIHKHDIMWAYKWMIEHMAEYYQISLSQIASIFTQYEDFCTRFDYSKRSYYQKLEEFIAESGIENNFGFTDRKDYHKKMLKCSRDGLSDCPACELDREISYILFVENDYEKALKKAEVIFTGRYSCSEIPHITYVSFAKWCFENGDIQSANDYAEKGYRVINRDYGDVKALNDCKGACILVFAYSNVEKALKVFKKTFTVCYDSRNSLELFAFYRASYHLMLQLERIGKKHIRFKFPDKLDPIYKETSTYSVTDLKDYFYEKAKFLADKFDERNKNSKFNDELNKIYEFECQED